jgi:hypothetical protein
MVNRWSAASPVCWASRSNWGQSAAAPEGISTGISGIRAVNRMVDFFMVAAFRCFSVDRVDRLGPTQEILYILGGTP